MLESGESICEAEVHDKEVEGAIAGSEGSLPFVAGSNADEVVGSPEVDLGEDVRIAEAIEEVRNEWERVAIFFGDGIEATPIDAQSERSVLFLGE